jgi:hypothetical protein
VLLSYDTIRINPNCVSYDNVRPYDLQKNHISYKQVFKAGLPDGIFSNQKNDLGKFWRVLHCKMLVGTYLYYLFGHFVYSTAIWYILWPFGIF